MDVQIAFLLTILAGLSTGIGSAIAFFIKGSNTKFLTLSMGFAAGVMLYVSFMEILPEAFAGLEEYYHSAEKGSIVTLVAFFGGMFLVAIIDKLIPAHENPHELATLEVKGETKAKDPKRLMRVGLLTALALALHNFPEGIATFVSALEDPKLGVTIAVAIALHNIPEGIAVSAPIYYATGSRSKAFWYSFLSGVVEPLGAFVGYLILMPYLGEGSAMMPILLAGVGGIMIFISLDQLLPAAEEYGDHHLAISGVVAGMLMMAVSLLLLNMGTPHTH